jgi:DNA-binding NarL/FixJ family response regulator
VLDINMPGESVLDFLKELREVDQDVPVVMLSGNAQLASVREAADLGADGFIRKDSPRAVITAELHKIFETAEEG